MTGKIKKYRNLIYIIYPLYVNFFLFTPFLHSHSNEENLIQPNKIDIHSHLLNSNHDDHTHHGKQHLDNCDDHEELYQLNTYKFTKLTKSLKIDFIPKVSSIIYIPSDLIEYEIKQRKLLNLASKLQWERYIHTATNTSPPIV